MTNHQNQKNNKFDAYLHCAAVIDEHGREIPITQDMIRRAVEKLEKSLQRSRLRPNIYPG